MKNDLAESPEISGIAVKRVQLVGIGNEYRTDDAAGLMILRRLAAMEIPDILCQERSGEGMSLMHTLRADHRVYLFDAVLSKDGNPGDIYRLDAARERIPSGFFNYSTHAFSVAEAVELARGLGQLPDELIIFGIEGKSFSQGLGLSPEVAAAVEKVVEQVELELGGAGA